MLSVKEKSLGEKGSSTRTYKVSIQLFCRGERIKTLYFKERYRDFFQTTFFLNLKYFKILDIHRTLGGWGYFFRMLEHKYIARFYLQRAEFSQAETWIYSMVYESCSCFEHTQIL